MFDHVIFASWPRGLYLAKKLSEENKKVAHVEVLPRVKKPFGFFLDSNLQAEKFFLESIGFLSLQEKGFCVLTSEGAWPLQDMKDMKSKLPLLKNNFNSEPFENHWLSYLSFNLVSKVFEYNQSRLSDQKLNLFSDYFLFESSFEKIEQFKKEHSSISFCQSYLEDISWNKKTSEAFVKDESFIAKKYIFLSSHAADFLQSRKSFEPHWQWCSCFLETDFGDYTSIIPSHFFSIKDILLPWSHENLLSVFHKSGQLEVWMRIPYKTEALFFIEGVKEHLKTFFPSCDFFYINKPSQKSLILYSSDSLFVKKQVLGSTVYVENLKDCSQGDLLSELQAEQRLFDIL